MFSGYRRCRSSSRTARLSVGFAGRGGNRRLRAAQAHHTAMGPEREHASIREILIEGDDNRLIGPSPFQDCGIFGSPEADVGNVMYDPCRTLVAEKLADEAGYVLVQEGAQGQRAIT